MDSELADGPPRALLIAALVVAVAAVVAILVIAVVRQNQAQRQPVPLGSVPAPAATGPECAKLIADLPNKLDELVRAPLADPAPAGAAAWRADGSTEPTVLRCGVDRPAEFVEGAPLQVVDDVQWFRVGDAGSAAGADDAGAAQQRSTWYAVDRGVYIALTLPHGSGPTPIQTLSAVIAKSLPAKPVDPAPAR
ncbi:DUF3515 domain-containing protein [Mycolicibacterium sp. GF69]|uniref:DUF3515 domain-containing protein n=1 Tax=Mycolicibacterium sp. GF69 TaxID=2267251 RepID=UPI000DCDA31D|nr:DUF3515 domain-containing protein [Mycolicibacterium sp. GF69]RAV14508.1 DUF3515 domain-containing protein [Mycolicibacterium sp. GF69]